MESNKRNTKKRTGRSQTSRSRSKSRSESRNKSKNRKGKLLKTKTYQLKKIEEESNEEFFAYKKFDKLDAMCYQELKKIPGLDETHSLIDETHALCAKLVPQNLEAFITATKILESNPLVKVFPDFSLHPSIRIYQLKVHKEYSRLDKNYIKQYPDHFIPDELQLNYPNPMYLSFPFKSSLVASIYELERFKSDFNPPEFNQIPRGTLLGYMNIIYAGAKHQIILGPIPYHR
jgi:hypothetical protein